MLVVGWLGGQWRHCAHTTEHFLSVQKNILHWLKLSMYYEENKCLKGKGVYCCQSFQVQLGNIMPYQLWLCTVLRSSARKLSVHYYNIWSSQPSTVYFWHVIYSYSQEVDAYHNVVKLIGMFQSLLPDYSCWCLQINCKIWRWIIK